MSYILDAVKKQQASDTTKQPQVLASQPTPVVPTSANSSNMLMWGLLLTCAIFLALLAGFWMGQQSATSSTLTTAQVEPVQVQEQTSAQQSQSSAITRPPTTSSTATEPLHPAEQMFQQPQRPVIAKREESKTEQQASVEEAQPLILGANTSRVNAKGELRGTSNSQSADLANVSASLLAKFNAAVDETSLEGDEVIEDNTDSSTSATRDITDLPVNVQNAISPFSFDMHIFQSNGRGWVKVDGQEYYQGERLANGVIIEEITPQHVNMSFDGYRFSMAALSSWQ